jgi:O-antigen/teichoic acid export membrane protein
LGWHDEQENSESPDGTIITMNESLVQNREKNSSTLREFAKDTAVYGFGLVAVRAASFLLIPIYTHSISVQAYGMLVTLITTIEILFVIMHIGLRTGYLRFAKEYEEAKATGKLMGTALVMNAMSGLIVICCSVVFFTSAFKSILHTEEVLGYVVLSGFSALTYSIFILLITYYRARNEARRFSLSSIYSSLLLVSANCVALLILNMDVQGVLISQIFTYSIASILVSIHVFRQMGFNISFSLMKKLFLFGFPLVFSMSGSLVMQSSSYYFLGYFNRLEDVAILGLASKISSIAEIVLISSFQIAYEPFVFSNINNKGIEKKISRLLTYLMLAYIFIAFAIILISRDLLSIIAPPEYSTAFLIIILILPSVAFRGVYYIGETLLNVRNRTFIIGVTVSLFALLSVLLNYIFIPYWGIFGAVITGNFISVLRSIIILVMGVKTFSIILEFHRLRMLAVLFVIFAVSFCLFQNYNKLMFYILNLTIVILSLFYLYFGDFFYSQEKEYFRGFLQKARLSLFN